MIEQHCKRGGPGRASRLRGIRTPGARDSRPVHRGLDPERPGRASPIDGPKWDVEPPSTPAGHLGDPHPGGFQMIERHCKRDARPAFAEFGRRMAGPRVPRVGASLGCGNP